MTRLTVACAAAILALLSGCGDSGVDKATTESSRQGTAGPTSRTTANPQAEALSDEPVDVVRTYLSALDAGDAATFCGLMTDRYTKSSIADAVEHDTIQEGTDCAGMVREFVKANQFEEVDSGDATLKEVSNGGTKAAVKVSYGDPTYPPYILMLVKANGRWLLDSERV